MMRDGLGGIDSVALIGGTSDIGLAIARELTGLGAGRYVLAGRDLNSMRNTAGDLPVQDVVTLDVGNVNDQRKAVDAIFASGDIDVVVLAAGVLYTDPSPQQIAEMATVNGSGSVSLLAELAERLLSQGHGHLVVLSSMAVVRSRPSNYWYGASKAGLDFAALGLAGELEGTGIHVTIVRPGFVHTKMTEGMRSAPFACKPEDVGLAVADAVRDAVGGVLWVPGVLRWVSYALRLLPRSFLHRIER